MCCHQQQELSQAIKRCSWQDYLHFAAGLGFVPYTLTLPSCWKHLGCRLSYSVFLSAVHEFAWFVSCREKYNSRMKELV